jgi:Fe2+ or Zn2+ uptake regulation protein
VNVYSGRVAQPQSQGLKVTDERLATLELMAKMFEEGKFKTEP